MNVLYLTANPNRSSSNITTEGWFRFLRSRGLAPVLASSRSGSFQTWVKSEGIPTYEVPLPFPSKAGAVSYARSLWRLRALVRKHQVDLIHSIEETVYPIAGDLARLMGLPVAVGIHCRLERGFATWAFRRWRRPQRAFFLTTASYESCLGAVDGVLSQSICRIVPNGLDTERFIPSPETGRAFRAAQNLGAGQLIGAASWLRPGKQLEHLIRVTANIPDPTLTLVLAGGVAPGEESYAAELLGLGERTLGPRFRYVGMLDDLRGFYNAMTLYVNTSKEETSGISVMESLSCGCPVVGYPSVAVAEQVPAGCGALVRQDDERELTEAVKAWLQNSELRRQAGAAARVQATEAFDVRRVAARLWDEYASLPEWSPRPRRPRT